MDNPDLGAEVAELEIDAPYARLFAHGDHVYVLHRDMDDYRKLFLTPINLSDPTSPAMKPALELPEIFDYYGNYYGWWMWGYWYYPRMDSVLQVGDTLVLHAARHWAWCNNNPSNDGNNTSNDTNNTKISNLDLDERTPIPPTIQSTL